MTAAMWYEGPSQRWLSVQHVNVRTSASSTWRSRRIVGSRARTSTSSGRLLRPEDEVPPPSLLDDDDEEVEYRPSTRLDRHHAPTRWRGILLGWSARHFRSGPSAPAAKMTSRAETESFLLPRESFDDDRRSSVCASSDGCEEAEGTATDMDPSSSAPEFSENILVTSLAASVAGGSVPPPRPLEARLPSIHTACSLTAASLLESRETIMGTASE
mmetsp:Transcript_43910/g.93419  ORF Transcript_43910/g.93419 Transcript_43910/m.93419 type:complete len:215 (+) Transcript_43910:1968-2612(+)